MSMYKAPVLVSKSAPTPASPADAVQPPHNPFGAVLRKVNSPFLSGTAAAASPPTLTAAPAPFVQPNFPSPSLSSTPLNRSHVAKVEAILSGQPPPSASLYPPSTTPPPPPPPSQPTLPVSPLLPASSQSPPPPPLPTNFSVMESVPPPPLRSASTYAQTRSLPSSGAKRSATLGPADSIASIVRQAPTTPPAPSCVQLDAPPPLSRATTAPYAAPSQTTWFKRATGSILSISTQHSNNSPRSAADDSSVGDAKAQSTAVSHNKRASLSQPIVLPQPQPLSPCATPTVASQSTRHPSLSVPRSPSSRSSTSSTTSSQSLGGGEEGRCKQRGCWMGAEMDGLCIQHFYAAEVTDKDGARSQWWKTADEKVKTPTNRRDSGKPFSFSAGVTAAASASASLTLLPLVPPPPAAAARDGRAHSELLLAELVQTEHSYLCSLTTAINVFLLRIRASTAVGRVLLSEDEIARVFVNLERLHTINLELYTQLCARSHTGGLLSVETANLLTAYCADAKSYVAYVCGYDDGRALLAEKRKASKDLDYLLRVSELCERCRLEDLLIQPVQRIPRYLLLLRSLLGQLSVKDSAVHSPFTTALASLSALASAINSSLAMHSAYQRVSTLAARILDPPFPLAQPHRYFLLDGVLNKKFARSGMLKLQTWKRYWFILFNDCLLYTTVPAERSSSVKVKHVLFLDMMRVRTVDDAGAAAGGRSSSGGDISGAGSGGAAASKPAAAEGKWAFEVASSVKCLVCSCDSEEERDRWVCGLNDAIDVALRDKHERRKDIDWSGAQGNSLSSSSMQGGEAKRLSGSTSGGAMGGLGGLSVVETDDWEGDEEYDSAGAAFTPSPNTPARRHTLAHSATPPVLPRASISVPALSRH